MHFIHIVSCYQAPLTSSALLTFFLFFALAPNVPELYGHSTISGIVYTFQVRSEEMW